MLLLPGKNRTGESRRDTMPLGTKKGYAILHNKSRKSLWSEAL